MGFDLNDEQKAAVEALRGGVLISAGAGSGKTRTLTERFVYALGSVPAEQWEPASVEDMLAITFTDKAAGELAERVRSALKSTGRVEEARAVDAAWIGTIHGLCARILRRHSIEAGLDPAFAVADTVEGARLQEQAFENAARESIEAGGGTLFAEYGFDVVFDATTTLARKLAVRGLAASALKPESSPRPSEIKTNAVILLHEAGEDIASCGDAGASASKCLAACRDGVTLLRELDASELTDDELAYELWVALRDWSPGRRAKAYGDTHDRLKEGHSELVALAASAASRRFALTLQDLVARYVTLYQEAKRARGLLDFEDLQVETLRLFRSRPDVDERYRKLFRLVMVDEFQDTDELQLSIVNEVAGANLCTVGDEQQSIYRFRGADVGVFRRHNEEMALRGARAYQLATNYRSNGSIIEFVNRVFSDECFFGDRLLALRHGRSEPQPGAVGHDEPRVWLTCYDSAKQGESKPSVETIRRAEAEEIAERFRVLRDEHGMSPGDMVVLLRAYSAAHIYADALMAQGFETAIVGGSRFFELTEISTMRALLRVIANPEDEEALALVMASQMGRFSDDALWRVRDLAAHDEGPTGMWEALGSSESFTQADDAEAARGLVGVIERARDRVGEMPLSHVLLRAVEEASFDLVLLSQGAHGRQAYANVLKLARMADAFESSGGVGAAAFAAYLDAKEGYADHTAPMTLVDEGGSAVRLMSIHSSKGLEFPVVAVPDLGAGRRAEGSPLRVRMSDDAVEFALKLPAGWSKDSASRMSSMFAELDRMERDEEDAERKRLFYVACTRAQEVLVLTGAHPSDKAPEPESGSVMAWVLCALGADAQVERTALGEGWLCSRTVQPVAPEAPACAEGDGSAIRWRWTVTEPSHSNEQTVPTRLSYSHFDLFKRCPMSFWARHVLRVGDLKQPSADGATGFGSVVHAILEIANGSEMPAQTQIEAIAKSAGLDARGIEKATLTARAFLESPLASRLAGCQVVRKEWPFAIAMNDATGAWLLAGAIDAYGRSDGDGLIVDYKTGASGSPEELQDRYRLQASVYALVALRDGCTRVEVVFTRPEVLGSDGAPQEVTYSFTASDAENLEAEICVLHERMAKDEFAPLAQWDEFTCRGCAIAGTVCPLPVPDAPRRS